MAESVFGRTNERVPRLWFGLMPGGDPEELVSAVCEEPCVVEVSGHTGMYGHLLWGKDVQIATIGGADIVRATDATHAGTLVGMHLVETLSALGRPGIDYYFLKVQAGVTEEQINGALNALDEAKSEGVIRFIGLYVEGAAQSVMGLWQFHDAFEAVMVSRNPGCEKEYESVRGMAQERRVGMVTCHPFNWGSKVPFFDALEVGFEPAGRETLAYYGAENPVLVGVKSAEEVRA